jgi:hypothetical protein
MALPKFLLQVRDGQRPTVYRYTVALASRSDMRPITGKEAKKILDKQEADRQARIEWQKQNLFEDGDDDFNDDDRNFEENPLTAEPDLKNEEKAAAQHPSFKTQDVLLLEETSKIKGFKTKNDLEVYILEKYQLDMIPGTREEMDEQAIAFVQELARHNRLYTKLNE